MKYQILNIKDKTLKPETLIRRLLENREIKTKKEIKEFLNPRLENVTIDNVGIDRKQLQKAIARIKQAIRDKEQIVIFGDYDVDGICGTAILWETLRHFAPQGKPYENVFPYIPHRIEEGYGLSVKGIENLKLKIENCGLIITVDNGIVANKAVDFANEKGIDVIITDHHVLPKKLPKALAIVHTTKLCGAGVAYFFSRVILNSFQDLKRTKIPKRVRDDIMGSHLELVALATVADLVPLKGANRTFLKFGLEKLKNTKRIGLLELFKEAVIIKDRIGVYEIGHIIAPRLNATGRLEYAMDSLRLLCTTSRKRAEELARKIGLTNRQRQSLTIETSKHAIELVKNKKQLEKLLIVVHESYQQGVIGLVAGKLVEEFYRPAIVISVGAKFSKASARSIKGFDMIKFIRTVSEFLVDAGGHPMAAGFTVETTKIPMLEKALRNKIGNLLDGDILERKLKIDCEIPLSVINNNLYNALQKLAPFGMGNPQPVFLSKNVVIEDMQVIGLEGQHVKFKFPIDGIAFNMGERAREFHIGDKVNIVYTIDEDEWLARQSLGEDGNGEKKLQLKIKAILRSSVEN